MSRLEQTRLLKSYPRLSLPMNLLTVTGSLLVALPFSIALFPQMVSRKATDLESRFHHLKDEQGQPLTV